MSVLKHYNQPIFFPKDYSEEPMKPYHVLYGKVHTFNVYYCRNINCLRKLCKTWDRCHKCGQKIDWRTSE